MKENEEIEFLEILGFLFKNKFKLLFVSFSLGFIFFIYSLFLPNIFVSESKLKVVDNEMSRQIEASNLGIFNVFQQSQSQRGYLQDHIESRDFFKRVSENTNIVILLLGYEKIENKSEDEIRGLLNSKSLKEKHSKKLSQIDFLTQHSVFKSSFEVDLASGPFTLRTFHTNPTLTKILIEQIVKETNSYFKDKDDRESSEAIKYISEELPKNNLIDVQATLNNVLSAKIRTLVLSNIKTDYVLEYIDSPFIPLSISLPSRDLYLYSGMLIGFFLTAFWLLSRRYLFKKSE